MSKSVLIVEDDYAIMRGLKDSFASKKYQVYTAMDGEDAVDQAFNQPVDIILLDIMLPKINGFEVCSRIREAEIDTPIIMLTAKGEESDVVRGLNLGADDYITKPFSIVQLHAKSEAFIRRYQKMVPVVYGFCGFQLCTRSRQLIDEFGVVVDLTPKEYALLHFFLRRDGYALTRDSILSAVWGSNILTTARSVDRCVNTLRKKIESNPASPLLIQSIRDVGYRFSSIPSTL